MAVSPGRPRSQEADEAILEATLELFAVHGYDGLSVETVAERAGVAKSTLYRRYPGKADLVLAAVSWARSSDEPVLDTGSLRGDLLELARRLRAKFTTDEASQMITALMAAAASRPDLAKAHKAFVAERRQLGIQALRRAVERGDLAADTDLDLLLDLVGGPIFYRAFVSHGPLDDETLEAQVDRVIGSFD